MTRPQICCHPIYAQMFTGVQAVSHLNNMVRRHLLYLIKGYYSMPFPASLEKDH